jgi:two-component system sensor histidine kinase KdpD
MAISIEREFFEEKARESERLQASEQLHQTLLASVSHELRTPLTALIGSATAAAEQVKGPQGGKLADMIAISGERLNRVIENLLDMTRLSSGSLTLKKEWQDIHDIVGVALRKLGPQGDNHVIRTNIDDQLGLVELDFRLMEHVISNLIYNSVTYSPGGTEIRINAWPQEDRLFLTVEDEGPGVPEETLPKLFDKFYRAPGTPTGGTGLGLAIARNIVDLHGGKISAQNRYPHGLKVTIELPLGKSPEIAV